MQNEIAPTEVAASAGASILKAEPAFNVDNTLDRLTVNITAIIAARHLISEALAGEVIRLAALGPREDS